MIHLANIKDSLRRWGALVKERDFYKCKLCNESNIKILEAHHIKSKSLYPEYQLDIANGITLCLKCHYLQHIDEPKAARLILYKIKKYYTSC